MAAELPTTVEDEERVAMRIAVTGGAGFIGSHVVDRFLADGHEVVVVDLRTPHRHDVIHAAVDVLDLSALVGALRGCDAVFHLAGVSNVNEAAAHPLLTTELNVTGTAKVWEAARHNDVGRAVLASTVWVYGAAVGNGPLDETAAFDLTGADHIYTASKLGAELVVQSCHQLFGQEFTILRYGIPYGPRMRDELVIARFVRMALDGETLTIHGDGSQSRNWVYVEDLAAAHSLVLAPKGANQVLNLEGTEAVSIADLIASIQRAARRPVPVEQLPPRPGDYDGRPVSSASAKSLIEWEPRVPFAEGLRRYIDWYLDERDTPQRRARAVGSSVGSSKPRRRLVAVPTLATSVRLVKMAAGLAIGCLGLAAAAVGPPVATATSILLIATAAAVLFARFGPRPAPPFVGVALVIASAWLLTQSPSLAVSCILAVVLGAGASYLLPTARSWRDRTTQLSALGAALTLIGLRMAGLAHAVVWAGAALAFLACTPQLADRSQWAARSRRVTLALSGGVAMFTAVLASWVGANSASATWFGSLISHGPRTERRVALTFDGGPDVRSTEAIRAILDANGVKGTFFNVGVALESRSDISRSLLDQGHLLGNRAYLNQPAAWWNPRYPQLVRAQRAFQQRLGVCPSFFRPPNGKHTPLMARAVHHQGMSMIGWDVSAGDRITHDAAGVSRRVLHRARPGSIILFHDGQNGDPVADRSVTVRALPAVLAGLRARGLQPVRLDELLHRDGYLDNCARLGRR